MKSSEFVVLALAVMSISACGISGISSSQYVTSQNKCSGEECSTQLTSDGVDGCTAMSGPVSVSVRYVSVGGAKGWLSLNRFEESSCKDVYAASFTPENGSREEAPNRVTYEVSLFADGTVLSRTRPTLGADPRLTTFTGGVHAPEGYDALQVCLEAPPDGDNYCLP